MSAPLSADLAQIGKSVVIKGELSGSEDLYVDGQVEGSISLKNYSLTVGPNGQVKASVEAKGLVVQGKLEGNIRAAERVELKKSAIVVGDIVTQRIAIEDGGYFKGKVEIQREAGKTEAAVAAKTEAPAAVTTGAATADTAQTAAAAASQKKA